LISGYDFMKKVLLLSSLFLLLLFSACRNDTSAGEGERGGSVTPYPEQPEAVIRQYQAHIDSNRFEQAKMLSTEAGKTWIDTLSKIINSSEEELDSTLLQTQFLKIDCQIKQDTALCNCLASDQDGAYEVAYTLIRQANQWKIDAPKEDDLWIDEQLIQDMIKQLTEE
jgi:hypothetical protein